MHTHFHLEIRVTPQDHLTDLERLGRAERFYRPKDGQGHRTDRRCLYPTNCWRCSSQRRKERDLRLVSSVTGLTV
jgi:hypothetical protein